jgi:hypothetical protein
VQIYAARQKPQVDAEAMSGVVHHQIADAMNRANRALHETVEIVEGSADSEVRSSEASVCLLENGSSNPMLMGMLLPVEPHGRGGNTHCVCKPGLIPVEMDLGLRAWAMVGDVLTYDRVDRAESER